MFRNLTSIQESAFQQIGMDGILRLNGDLTILEIYAFAADENIKQIEFGTQNKPMKLTELSDNVFWNVDPDKVTYYVASENASLWENWKDTNKFNFKVPERIEYSPVIV
jgi:hypothetical protein